MLTVKRKEASKVDIAANEKYKNYIAVRLSELSSDERAEILLKQFLRRKPLPKSVASGSQSKSLAFSTRTRPTYSVSVIPVLFFEELAKMETVQMNVLHHLAKCDGFLDVGLHEFFGTQHGFGIQLGTSQDLSVNCLGQVLRENLQKLNR
jgi:hypothetical protein